MTPIEFGAIETCSEKELSIKRKKVTMLVFGVLQATLELKHLGLDIGASKLQIKLSLHNCNLLHFALYLLDMAPSHGPKIHNHVNGDNIIIGN